MNAELVLVLCFVCAALLAGGVALVLNDVFFRYKSALNERLEGLTGTTKGEANPTLFDLNQLAAATAGPQSTWRSRLSDLVEQSGLNLSMRALLVISACTGAALAIGAYVAVRQWWALPVGLTSGAMVPLVYVHGRRNLRIRNVSRQLPDVFEAMARSVRAGQTVPAAFQLVADEYLPPISEEFWYCYEQQNLGISYDAALRNLARRLPVMELRILVVALLVQSRSGGNLIELLTSLSTMARKRIKMQQRMKALTGEARMQAAVLVVLPIVALIAVMCLSPDYGRALLDRPWLLAVTGASEVIGALWIRHIVRLEI